jgi:transcription initiation factor IIE alpha subunit
VATIKQNSLSAYHNLNRHRINSQIGRILEHIKISEIPLNDRRLSIKTGLPINIVESRLCQLSKEGLITYAGSRLDHVTGNYSRTWKPTP